MLGLLESEKNVDKSPGQGHGGQRGKLSSSNRDRGGDLQEGDIRAKT